MPGPLAHLTVLDLSRVLAGPWCTQLLADLGATVIKIEKPGVGDDTRAWAPPYLKDALGADATESAYYLACNRGKLSVAVDFTTPEGRDLVRDLARQCDVLIENFKVGGLAKYGLDYANVAAINPRLVYASITGFGQEGPYAERAGYDFIIQGMSGFMSVTGERDDRPGGGPQKAGIAISDIMTGMYAAVAILAALGARDRSGQGQHVDCALFDSAVAGVPEWAADPRYARNADRVRHRAMLVPMIERIVAARTQRDWLAALESVAVPCGPINRVDAVFADPQILARGMRLDLPHPLAGQVPLVGPPVKLSRTPLAPDLPPPLLAQHTEAVLRERLGLSVATLARLAAAGVVGLPA